MLKLFVNSFDRDLYVGLADSQGFIARHIESNGKGEVLADLVQELLEKNQRKLSEISQAILCVGPGSFTGLRTSLAYIQGVAFAQNLQIWGLSSLRILSELNQNPTLENNTQKPLAWAILAQTQKWYIGFGKVPKINHLEHEDFWESPFDLSVLEKYDWCAPVAFFEQFPSTTGQNYAQIDWLDLMWKAHLQESNATPSEKLTPRYLQKSAAEKLHG